MSNVALMMNNHHVFLSYCRENQSEVARLRDDLLKSGESVWWDQDILPGQDWKQQIRQAMKQSYAVVICLSKELATRNQSGVYPEIYDSITAYRQQVPGSVFIIPVRLSECEAPEIAIDDFRTLSSLQLVDLFPETRRTDGLNRLLQGLKLTIRI